MTAVALWSGLWETIATIGVVVVVGWLVVLAYVACLTRKARRAGRSDRL